MVREWKETLLEDLAEEITVGFVGSMTSEYVDDGIPFLRSKNVSPYSIIWDDMKYVSRQFHQKIKKSALSSGDVVIVRTGKPGTASIIPDSIEEANCSDLVIVRPGPDLDKRFLVYYLNSAAKHHINAHLVGAVQQHFNVGAAKKMCIPTPPLPEQKAIAHILGSLDDKIELNRRMNETLEGMAQALFKSWFVDFDPVIDNAIEAGNPIPEELAERAEVRRKALADGTANREVARQFPDSFQFTEELGWIPEGWGTTELSEIANIKGGKRLPKGNALTETPTNHPYIRTCDISGTEIDLNGLMYVPEQVFPSISRYIVEKGDIIISIVGTIGVCALIPNELHLASLTENCAKITTFGNETIRQNFIYYYLNSPEGQEKILSRTVGSTQLKLPLYNIKSVPIQLPPASIINKFNSITNPLQVKISANRNQNRTLVIIRDTLLPKLISGELRIPEAEKQVTEALI